MNPLRALVPELVVGLAACLGAHLLLADTLSRRLGEARATLADLEAELADLHAARQVLPASMRALEQVQRRVDRIHARSELVTTDGALFEAIHELADRHAVRVEQLEPIRVDAFPNTATRAGDACAAYQLTVAGAYASVARFVDALTRDVGFTAVDSCQITPAPGPDQAAVLAVIRTRHYAFDASPLDPPSKPEDAP